MFKLIKSPEGLRLGNLIFVDSFVFPPNFICAQPVHLGEGFEQCFNADTIDAAYLNADYKWMKQLLPVEDNGILSRDGFTAEKVQESVSVSINETPTDSFGQLPKWKIKFEANEAEISFIHELQNYYKDWTGKEII